MKVTILLMGDVLSAEVTEMRPTMGVSAHDVIAL